MGAWAHRHAVAILCLVSLTIPASKTAAWDISRLRPGTRQLAKAFIEENFPWGTGVIHEAYMPRPDPRRNPRMGGRFAARHPMEVLRNPKWDLVMLTPNAYRRFFVEQRDSDRAWVENRRRQYEEMFTFPLVKEFRPGRWRAGPWLYIYQTDPE